jgi:hypothetical protein
VRRLSAAGAQRLVLDLRDNRGGLVSEGVEVARLFLGGDALVVRTEGRARASAAPITAPGPPATDGAPHHPREGRVGGPRPACGCGVRPGPGWVSGGPAAPSRGGGPTPPVHMPAC